MISSQDALTLLRASFSTPRVLHLMRCSPSVDHNALISFDDTLRSAFRHITNSDVSDTQWLQASLPVKDGGLGIRAASLALPAFLASAASTSSLQDSILAHIPCPSDSFFDTRGLHHSVVRSQPTHFCPSSRFGIDRMFCRTEL